jgi:hypothetical protein
MLVAILAGTQVTADPEDLLRQSTTKKKGRGKRQEKGELG